MKKNIRNGFIYLVTVILFFLFCFPVSALSVQIISHRLDVSIDVKNHLIRATDYVDLGSFKDKGEIFFSLNKNLNIKKISSDANNKLSFDKKYDMEGDLVITLQKNLPLNLKSILIEYEGKIYNPVRKSQKLSFVIGDRTEGVIAPEGVYLSGESRWYPIFNNVLSKFEVTVEIDGDYKVVTQGNLLFRQSKNKKSVSRWKSDIPVDNLALVAGKYFINSMDVDGIKLSTYFLNDNKELAEKYLRKCGEYLKIYSELLGRYPYKRFDVVESFFSSGYGFPYFTLLGSGVFQRGVEAFRPGYLDHEIVHSWWGNYVYNDFHKGNWVEALTTYSSNYYYKESKEGRASASRHRKRVSETYSLNVNSDRDYPVRAFKGKIEDYDGDIGYGKGSMIFHQLRLVVGNEVFWSTLKELARRFGGNYAEWADIQDLFEEKSGKSLNVFFRQWLDRKGGPRLKFENMKIVPVKRGYKVSGSVVQSVDHYKAMVPLHVDYGFYREEIFHVDIAGKSNSFSFDVDKLPVSVKLDPEFHLFRILAPEEIPPTLNATLADREKIFFISDEDRSAEKKYEGLAKRAVEQKGGRLKNENETLEKLLENNSVFILGKGFLNLPTGEAIAEKIPSSIKIQKNSFMINGKKYEGAEYSLLLTIQNPFNVKKTVTIYYGLGLEALGRARYIFYYGKDGYLLFKNGKPVARGDIKIFYPGSLYNVPKSLSTGIKSEKLMSHVKALAADEMEGRLAGSPGAEKALQYIEAHLKKMDLVPERQSFKVQFNNETINKLRLNIKDKEKDTTNIMALLRGNDPELAKEAIIIGAHYDHFGRDVDGNIYHGADDNASGVAALLEIAGKLMKKKTFLKRSVIFVFFSGEEWKCNGSKFFIDNMSYPELKKIAMLNVDAIGRGMRDYYSFIGASYYPALFNIAKKFSGSLGLQEGKNIDKYAYVDGSDHYPFHLKGIPAVDFYSSDYREMNSLKDTVSKIDENKLTSVSKLVYTVLFQILTDPSGLKSVRFSEEKHLANLKQLTFEGENAEAYFSSDGERLIFQSTRDRKKCDQIYTMTIEGEELKLVSTGEGVTTCAYFFPDDSGLVYASTHSGSPACPPKPDHSQGYVWPLYKDYDVFRSDLDGSNIVRLTDTPGYDAEATISPDGKKIVFTSVRDGDLDLYSMDADGRNVKRLTDEPGYDGGAFYSHDSKKIVYRANRIKDPVEMKNYKNLLAKGLIKPGRLEIFVMDSDGSNKKQVTNNGAANFCPFMHPDGKKIIFSSNMDDPKGRNFELYIINTDGTGLERLTYNPTFDGFPMFSPDGKKLVFGSNRNNRIRGETNVFIADWAE